MMVGRTMEKKVIVKIHELMVENKLTLRQFSLLTDIRHPALSELENQKRQNINFGHIEKIADALNIDDIRKIIDFDQSSKK
jgi:DNA-binding Xre family transcriptional regulator